MPARRSRVRLRRRPLGILATLLGRFDDAAKHFEEALRMNQRMGARPWVAHTQDDHARMLLRRNGRGDRERADELLARAQATYRELGMRGAEVVPFARKHVDLAGGPPSP